MLKKRIIGVVLVKDGIAVQSIAYRKYLPIGKPSIVIEYLNNWGIDEIILNDISATRNNYPPNFKLIRESTKNSQVPITLGGGINSIDHINTLMKCGVDKVVLNQSALINPSFIHESSQIFGSQCIVVSLDCIKVGTNYRLYDYLKNQSLDFSPIDYAIKVQELGAGEIFLNSVDRDGSKLGFDTILISQIKNNVNIPVIGCGGAGTPEHFSKTFSSTKVGALAAANIFNFFEHSVTIIKAIVSRDHTVRCDTQNNYFDNKFDHQGRLNKKKDDILEKLLYLKIEEEKI